MNTRSERPSPTARSDFPFLIPISTRWSDNDVYGHVNNVVYFAFFDTAVNQYLIAHGIVDFVAGDTIGLVVHNECDYFAPLSFPGWVYAGIRVSRAGSSSVEYDISLFAEGEDSAAARGCFVHVYVDRVSRRPQPLPENFRRLLIDLPAPPLP